MITVFNKYFQGYWHVDCSVTLPSGTRTGLHSVELGESATDAEIEAAILALYSNDLNSPE